MYCFFFHITVWNTFTYEFQFLSYCKKSKCWLMTLPVSGFLVPAVGSGGHTSHCVVVLLEGLEKASSLTGLLGDLCHSLDNRGSASPLVLNTGESHCCQPLTWSIIRHTVYPGKITACKCNKIRIICPRSAMNLQEFHLYKLCFCTICWMHLSDRLTQSQEFILWNQIPPENKGKLIDFLSFYSCAFVPQVPTTSVKAASWLRRCQSLACRDQSSVFSSISAG